MAGNAGFGYPFSQFFRDGQLDSLSRAANRPTEPVQTGSLFRVAAHVPRIEPNAVYTLAEAAALFRISEATVRRLVRLGVLKSAKLGRTHRFLGSHLLCALYPEFHSEPG